MITIEPKHLDKTENYKLLIGSILPRPIALVSTTGADGSNAAPFSFFTSVSVEPPMVGFTCLPGADGTKDTLRNIRESGEFVVNIVSKSILEKVNDTAVNLPRGVSEFTFAGFTEQKSEVVKAPRVGESKIHMECKLNSILDFGHAPACFIVGEVVLFHVHDDVILERYRINNEILEPVGRMGGDLYTLCQDLLTLKRKKYDEL